MADAITSITVGGVERLTQATTWTGNPNSFASALFGNMGRVIDLDAAWWSTAQAHEIQPTRDVLGFDETYNYMQVSPDGKRLYAEVSNNTTDDRFVQWNLNPPWDVGSAQRSADTFIYGGTAQFLRWFAWSDDGSKFYVSQFTQSKIEQFSANKPFEIGSIDATAPDQVGDLSEGGLLQSGHFVQNGSRFISLTSSAGSIYLESWSLSTPFDITTINYEARSQNIQTFGLGFGLTRYFDFLPGGKVAYITSEGDELFPFWRVEFNTAYDVQSIPSSLPISASTGDIELITRLGLNTTSRTNDFRQSSIFFARDGCSIFLHSDLPSSDDIGGGAASHSGRFFRIDLACHDFFVPPSSDEANAATPESVGSKSSAPYVNRDIASSQFLNGNCITIQSTAVGACSSEEVAVVKVGDVDFTISNKFLGNDSFCGGLEAHLFDSYGVQNSTATIFITSADHLAGEIVGAWGDGQDLGFYKVSSTGTFTIPVAATSVTYGIPYNAWFKSVKLAYSAQAEAGTPLLQRKKVNYLGFVLYCAHARGLEYGPSTDKLNPMPRIESGKLISPDAIWPHYDKETIEFPGEWDTDSRVVLKARAPRGVTVLAAITQVDTREKI